MNSYFDHSTGFYNPAHQASAEAQAAYRSFSQSLSTLATPQSPYPPHQSSWSNGSIGHSAEQTSPYVDSACKVYYSPSQQGQYKSDCALAKESNGFKSPEPLHAMPPSSSSWGHNSQSIRSSQSVASSFDSSNCPRSESCSACYVSSPSVPQGNLSTTINLISSYARCPQVPLPFMPGSVFRW